MPGGYDSPARPERTDPDPPPGTAQAQKGLRDAAEWDVGIELVTELPEQYREMLSEHVSPAVTALEHLDEATRKRALTLNRQNHRAQCSKDDLDDGGRRRC
jgi:hypothetical protein